MSNKILSSILNERYIDLVSGGAGSDEGTAEVKAEVKKDKKSFIARHNEALLITFSVVATASFIATAALGAKFGHDKYVEYRKQHPKTPSSRP